MFHGVVAEFSNREDWVFTPYSIEDDQTGELVDISSASIEVAVTTQDGCLRFSGDIDDGTVILVEDDTFQIIIPRTTATTFCPGNYDIGVTVTNAGETISLIIGTIAVLDGKVPA